MRLYNTLGRSVQEFKPADPARVSVYTCGPTVYNFQHVGNFRTFLFEDVLVRVLKYGGFGVRRVMNITDVGHLVSDADTGEDKMEAGARREGKSVWEVAAFYTEAFWRDFDRMGLLRPDVVCKATDHIAEQIDLVRRLEAKGLAYVIPDGVYFDTARLPDYGKLEPERLAGQKAGARVEVAEGKRSPNDFALWKLSSKGSQRQMEWDSPWGWGFPGWHIECSAMAMKYLGETFDIHCGGIDHVPVHHTNEIAQSEGATGKPFARLWMHGEFLVLDKAKMAKSAGTFLTLDALQEKGFSPMDYRYFCFTAHYRKQLAFTWEGLEAAKNALSNLREKVRELPASETRDSKLETRNSACGAQVEAFLARVEDDLDIPGAVAVLWNVLKDPALPGAEKRAFVERADDILGLGLAGETKGALDAEVEAKISERIAARKAKDFARADAIRQELLAKGIELEDTPRGTTWRKR